MKIVELIRLQESEQEVIGALKIDKEVFCWALEPADRLNRINESCIPAQQYICFRHLSVTFGETFQVSNVPGRSSILFHAGNIAGDTSGCILLGQTIGKLKGERAILNSGKTFKEFMRVMGLDSEFHLTISEVY